MASWVTGRWGRGEAASLYSANISGSADLNLEGASTVSTFLRNLGRIVGSVGNPSETLGLIVRDQTDPSENLFLVGRDEEDGAATFMLLRPGAEEGDIVAKVQPGGGSGLHVRRDQTPGQVQLNVFPNGQPAVLVGMKGGKPHIGMTVDAETEAPELIVSDREGRVRISLGLEEDGSPHLVFYDEEGNRTWEAGGWGAIPRKCGLVMREDGLHLGGRPPPPVFAS